MILTHGYDVSAYQPKSPVPAADFGFVKTSEGTSYRNPKFKTQWASAGGKWEVPGVYHFAHPEQSSAAQQVSMISSMAKLEVGQHRVMLDLETSQLTQRATNDWAKKFGDECRAVFPEVKTVVYFGGGYATNGTGKGLADYFDDWMYPQYPAIYRLGVNPLYQHGDIQTVDDVRAVNRSDQDFRRFLLSAPKSDWPTSIDQLFLPAGAKENTGFKNGPKYWQFSDNHTPGGVDASVSSLTVAEMLGVSAPSIGDKEMPGDVPPLRLGERFTYSGVAGAVNIWGIVFDSPEKLTYRIAAHKHGGKGVVQSALTVGGPTSDTDTWPRKVTWKVSDIDIDWWSIELTKCEGPTADWDPSMPDRNGRVVRPFWDASFQK